MAPQRAKRSPDAAVATAVDQVIKQQKSKRMMLFGLRNLSELCSITSVKYKENSLDALGRGIVPVLKLCAENYVEDEEVMGLCIKVLFGISEALMEGPEPDLVNSLKDQGGPHAGIAILNGCPAYTDDAILPVVLSYLSNLGKLKIDEEKTALVLGLVGNLRRKMKPDTLGKLLGALSHYAEDPTCADALIKKQAVDHILEVLTDLQPSDATTPVVEAGFTLVQKLSKSSAVTVAQMNSVIKVMDVFKNKKTIAGKGSAILVSRLGPDELKKCLKNLAEAQRDSSERQEALVMLSSLSYISSYAEAVAKSGGIPTLCNAITTSLADLGGAAPDAQLVKGLNGACKMLGKIAENAIHLDDVVNAGGLQALASAVHVGTNLPATFSITCEALTPLIKRPALAAQLLAEGTFKQILSALSHNIQSYDVVSASLTLLAAVVQQDAIADALYDLGAIDVLDKCLTAHITDIQIQLLPRLESFKEAESLHAGVLKSLNYHGAESEALAVAALELFERLLDVPDAQEALQNGETVDAVLGVMLAHQDVPHIQFIGKFILTVVATEDDVRRCLKGLDRAITGARRNPEDTYRSLAAVNGLSQIGRLKPIFEQHHAAAVIQTGIKGWIEGQPFAEQQRIIRAAARSVESLTTGSSEPMDDTVLAMLQSCLLPQLKGLLEKQAAQDNNVLDLVKCCKSMCTQRQVTSKSLGAVVEAITKVSWKYQEWRKIQIECLDILREIAALDGGTGARLLQEGGAMKLVISYMQKVAIHEDVQVAGLGVLAACLKEDPNLAEPMRFAGAVEACKQARSTHPDSVKVKMLHGQVYPILMPSDASDTDIKNAVVAIDQSAKMHDIAGANTACQQLLGLLNSEAACRAAVYNKVGVVLNQATALISSNTGRSADLNVEIAANISKVMALVTDSRSGAQHLTRVGGVETLTKLFNTLSQKSVPDGTLKRDGIAANVHAQGRLLKTLKPAEVAAAIKHQIAGFCLMIEEYPDDTRIGGAAAQALAIVPSALLTKNNAVVDLLKKLAQDLKHSSMEIVGGASVALAELLKNADAEVAELWLKQGRCIDMFDCLEKHRADPTIRTNILECLTALTKHVPLAKVLVEEGGEEARSQAIRTLVTSLEVSMDDENAVSLMVNLLNELTTSKDKALLTSLGVPELVTTLLSHHSDNKELASAVGDLLGKTGAGEAIESLINQIIATATKRPADWQRALETLCGKLAATLPAAVDDIKKAFSRVPEMCECLAAASTSEKGDATLQVHIAAVARRLADRFESDPDSPYGVRAMQAHLLPALVQALASDTRACQNRQFIVNGYRTLAVAGFNPTTHDALVKHASSAKLVPTAFEELRRSQNDADVTARILEFFAALSSSEQGLALVTSQYPGTPPSGTSIEEHIAGEVFQQLRKHKGHGAVIAAGIAFVGNLALRQTQLLDRKYLDELGASAEGTPLGIVALMNVFTKVLHHGHGDLIESELPKVDDRFHTAYQAKGTTDSQKLQLALAYVDFIAAVAAAGRTEILKRPLVLDNLATLLEDFSKNPQALHRILRALHEAADADADVNAKIARTIPAILFTECAATVSHDPMLVTAALELLYSLGCNEGNGKVLSTTANFSNFVESIAAESTGFEPQTSSNVKTLLESVKVVVEQDTPKAQTLKEVYEKWEQHKLSGETLEIAEAAAVMQQFDFVCEYTEEYSKEPLKDLSTELGMEFSYGCKCFTLLHDYPQNTGACIESGEHRMLLAAMSKQKVEEVAQCAVETAVALCAHPEGANSFAHLTDATKVTVEMVERVRVVKHASADAADAMMVPRLDLIKACALDRDFYNDTSCMMALISVWNDCDANTYTTETLRAVFQAMRKIVNASWVDIMRQNRVPKRLIHVVETGTDPGVLRDVLFLLGALASVPEMKTLIGELKGVEACLDLAQRCLKGFLAEESNPVLTNCCLALARITIGHGPNISKFIAAKGVETNVAVINYAAKDGLDFDVGNGASVLMCNLCYRRDDLKEQFGKLNGPKAISEAIRKYDGSDSRSAFRCLMSMLMAIGNLALYVPNVNAFLEQEVEKTFAHLYTNSEFLPDELLEVSLRTMSNLVLENTDEYMLKFGAVLQPLVNMLKMSPRESVKMLALAFEVIGSLCRLPVNADAFIDSGGVEIALRTVNTHQDFRLCLMVVHVCSVLATHKEKVPQLIDAGVFQLLTNLFNGQVIEDLGESCITGLRCARRMMVETTYAMQFIQTGGAEAVVHVIMASTNGTLVQYEACTTLIALLTMCPPPPTPAVAPDEHNESDWDAEVADEGVLGFVHRIERPPGPRAWGVLQLNTETIRALVMQFCGAMLAEGGRKQKKLQLACLHLLAYFACEKIPQAVEGFYAGQYTHCLTNILEQFAKDLVAVKACCITLANVSYVSEREDYRSTTRDKNLLSALETAASAIPRKTAPEIHDFCTLTYKLLAEKDPNPQKFKVQAQWDYDLNASGWNVTAYPNGVQDLPPDIKKVLREGGRAKLVVDPKTRVPFWWKASQDLTRLQWRLSDDQTASYNHQFPVVRLRAVSQGLATPLLEAAGAKDRKIDDKVCLVLVGPASEEAPNGLELNIKTKSRKERDALWQNMVEWKDAATYGA